AEVFPSHAFLRIVNFQEKIHSKKRDCIKRRRRPRMRRSMRSPVLSGAGLVSQRASLVTLCSSQREFLSSSPYSIDAFGCLSTSKNSFARRTYCTQPPPNDEGQPKPTKPPVDYA